MIQTEHEVGRAPPPTGCLSDGVATLLFLLCLLLLSFSEASNHQCTRVISLRDPPPLALLHRSPPYTRPLFPLCCCFLAPFQGLTIKPFASLQVATILGRRDAKCFATRFEGGLGRRGNRRRSGQKARRRLSLFGSGCFFGGDMLLRIAPSLRSQGRFSSSPWPLVGCLLPALPSHQLTG